MRKRSRHYIYFFVAALLLQFIAVLKVVLDPPTTLNFSLYRTAFKVDEFSLIEYTAVFYFVLGLGYWILRRYKRKPNRALADTHTLITVGSLVAYIIVMLFQNFDDESDFTGYYRHNETFVMLALPVVGIAQLLYIINIFVGIKTPYHRHRHKRKDY